MEQNNESGLAINLVLRSFCIRGFRTLKNVVVLDIPNHLVLLDTSLDVARTLMAAFRFLQSCVERGVAATVAKYGTWEKVCHYSTGFDTISFHLEFENMLHPATIYQYSLEIGPKEVSSERLVLLDCRREETKVVFEARYGKLENVLSSAQNFAAYTLTEPVTALSVLANLQSAPEASLVRDTIINWHLSDFSANAARNALRFPQERLQVSGENLLAVLAYCRRNHPKQWEQLNLQLQNAFSDVYKLSCGCGDDGYLQVRFHDSADRLFSFGQRVSDECLAFLYYQLLATVDQSPLVFVGSCSGLSIVANRVIAKLLRNAAETRQVIIASSLPEFLANADASSVAVITRDQNTSDINILTTDVVTGLRDDITELCHSAQKWVAVGEKFVRKWRE